MKSQRASQTRKRVRRKRSAAEVGSFTLAEVAEVVGGHVAGDPALRFSGLDSINRATPADLSWLASGRLVKEAAGSRAGALLVAAEADAGGRPCVVVENPTLAMTICLSRWRPARRPRPGVSRRAFVHPSARLGAHVAIAAGATIEAEARIGDRTVVGAGAYVGERARIGADSRLHPLAAVLDGCDVGSRCVLHSGAVVGSDGFGYVWDGSEHRKIPQTGTVRVEDDVEIGANSAIDRATFGETVIGRGTKIDNLVQIGHNVVVGPDSILCGQAGVAGSSRLGERVTLAGQAGIGDHVEIGEGAVVTGQAGVVGGGRVAARSVVSGMPAAPHRDFLRRAAWVARLPDLARRVERLEKKLGDRED